MSAFGGKADVNPWPRKCLLIAISGHSAQSIVTHGVTGENGKARGAFAGSLLAAHQRLFTDALALFVLAAVGLTVLVGRHATA